jgi:hypothetical protein
MRRAIRPEGRRRLFVCMNLPNGLSRFCWKCHALSVHMDLQADVKVRPYGVRVKDIIAAISALRAAVGGRSQ